jgi:hypothetical protein
MFISFLYMFQATMCPSSGETTVFMRQLVLVILYGWLSGIQGMHTNHPYRITSTKCRTNTVISPDDGHSHPKHVEKRNKHTKKNCAPSWLYLQDCTGMHGQQNIKFSTPLYWAILLSFQTLFNCCSCMSFSTQVSHSYVNGLIRLL